MKALKQINGELVSITLSFEYPPIPFRGNDWCAWYSDDDAECPNCGWGATPELAIEDLTDSYDPADKGHDYEPDYDAPTAREEQLRTWNEKHNEKHNL